MLVFFLMDVLMRLRIVVGICISWMFWSYVVVMKLVRLVIVFLLYFMIVLLCVKFVCFMIC